MKYTNCPTCGGAACYVSPNFERAGILFSTENTYFQDEIRYITSQLVAAMSLVDTKIEDMNSDQLFSLYRNKLHQEIIDKEYYKAEKSWEYSIRKMIGDL